MIDSGSKNTEIPPSAAPLSAVMGRAPIDVYPVIGSLLLACV
jgi:hypothetical protein